MAGFSLIPSGNGTNYTGMLTRSIVFSFALIIFLATTGMSLAAIIVPEWVLFDGAEVDNRSIHTTYGLHRRCTDTTSAHHTPGVSSNAHCTPFPRYTDCQGEDRYFCSMWRSVGFLMSFGIVLEGMTIAAFAVLLIGGKQKREQGWGFMATVAALSGIVQAIAMAIVAYLFTSGEQFFHGGSSSNTKDAEVNLGTSWTLCTVSWLFQAIVALAITLAALCLPSEGGYELIPDRSYDDES